MKTRERSAAEWIPPHPSLPALRQAAARCQGCDLYRRGTQTVFGKGPSTARLLLVGEQPGDADVYVTNAVKHFKRWKCAGPRGTSTSPTCTACASREGRG